MRRRERVTPELSAQLSDVELAYGSRSYLLRNPDVLGYGVGYRVKQGVRTDEPALVVYVRKGLKSRDLKAVARHRRVPTRVRVPGPDGPRWLPVDLVEAGVGELCASVSSAVTVCNCRVPNGFGTVGWVARQADGTPVFCSCYHVLLPDFFSPPREKQLFVPNPAVPQFVTCPSPGFGGNTELKLGRVVRGVRSPTADLALAEAEPGVDLSDFVQAVGAPRKPPRELSPQKNPPGQGEPVQVGVGHHGPIRGRLMEFPATVKMKYPDFPEYAMNDLIATDAPVRPGDSGALLLDEKRHPIGMLVGRDVQAGRSYFMPMSTVMGLNLSPL
jgi:hypothetical protein